ncbi:MAG: mechanosensitive ion channel domain-containing protein [Pseudomonadota bacterium]
MNRTIALALLLLGTFWLKTPLADTPSAQTLTETEAAPTIPAARRTPKASYTTFLDTMDRVIEGDAIAISNAIEILDLSAVNPLVRIEKGTEIAWTLREVLERLGVDEPQLPVSEEGPPYVLHTFEAGALELMRVEGQGWLFSRRSIEILPDMLDELMAQSPIDGAQARGEVATYLPVHLRIRASLPANLKIRTFILERWQWLGILVVVLLGIVLDRIIAGIFVVVVRTWRSRAKGAYRNLSDSMLRPFGLMAMAFVWWAGLKTLGLPSEALVVLLISAKFLACFASVWAAYRLVDLLGAYLLDGAQRTQNKLDDVLVPLITKTVKVFVTVMGIVFVADNLDVDVTSLLAGLGLGGLAFALAAKDVAGNLFGSITVILDQTFNVGDWVVIDDVEGTVEQVGFRSTRIRTFYNSLVSVPNAKLITANVDNMGKRRFRRLSCKLSIAYDTPPDRIDAFCEGIREIVRLHKYTRKDYFHIYLNDFAAASIDVLVYVFWETPDWGAELRERHRFLLDCLRLAKRLGVEFAFPTQTIFMRQGEDTPLPAQTEQFAISGADEQALEHGRREAQAMVQETLKLKVVPDGAAKPGPGSAE